MKNRNPQSKMKIGLIGYGYWGPNFARIINESNDCCLKYCCDVDEAALQRIRLKYSHIIASNDYRDILKDDTIDAVIIVSPTKTHYAIAKDCLLAKKHVLVEKPITQTIEEAQDLIRLAKENGAVLMVGHVFLFNPAVRFIEKTIDEGQLGRLRHLHFQRRSLGPIRKDVNVLWDLAPHDISMALRFIKKPAVSVIASGEVFLQENIHDVVSLSIKFCDSIMVNMIFSWIDPVKIRDVAIVGDKKMILFDDVNQTEKIRIFNKNANIIRDTCDVSFGEYQISLHSGDVFIPSIVNKEPLKEELNHFLECIRDLKKPLTDGENGLEVVKILCAVQESLENNSKLVKI